MGEKGRTKNRPLLHSYANMEALAVQTSGNKEFLPRRDPRKNEMVLVASLFRETWDPLTLSGNLRAMRHRMA